MLICAFIASLLMGNKSWQEIVRGIKAIKFKQVGMTIVRGAIWAAIILVGLFIVFRLLKVAFWVVVLGLAVSLARTLITEQVIKIK
ncbi:MAG: hypothetical protein KBS63_02175 [Clostridiales bacterium]|nr:hypothetical protein [Candidatus Crickella caballi]